VNHGRGGQGVVVPLPPELPSGQVSQVLIDDRQQPIDGLGIPPGHLGQDLGYVDVLAHWLLRKL
jgi:hypothetical protein